MVSVGFSGRAEDKVAGRFTLVVCVSECMVAFGVDRCKLWVPVVTNVNASLLLKCPVCCCWGQERGLCVPWLRYGQRTTSGSRSSPSTLFEKVCLVPVVLCTPGQLALEVPSPSPVSQGVLGVALLGSQSQDLTRGCLQFFFSLEAGSSLFILSIVSLCSPSCPEMYCVAQDDLNIGQS